MEKKKPTLLSSFWRERGGGCGKGGEKKGVYIVEKTV